MTADKNLQGPWPRPALSALTGQHVTIARVDPDADIADLYDVSHRTPEFRALWKYMFHGPFADQATMYKWLQGLKASTDPIFYSVYSIALQKKVGIFSLMNIVPDMGRLELGNIWYSPLVQRTFVNTEVTFLFLRHVFSDLGYRRVEWKCDNRNERSKQAARRMGFVYEGLFRQHMIVKGENRDTAWFSLIDAQWPTVRENFAAYLSSSAPSVSLTALNATDPH